MPAPASTAYGVRPRACAEDARSSTNTPAPSPSTKPSRFLSNGREARCGSSLRVDIARICAKPAMLSGWMHASVPPTTTMSARSSAIRSNPAAIASAPDAHALTVVCTPARAPISRPDVRSGAVGHIHRDHQRRDPARALLPKDVVLGEQAGHAAYAGADHHRDPGGVEAVLVRAPAEPGIGPGLARRHDRCLLTAVQAPGLHPRQFPARIDRHRCRDAHAEVGGPVLGQRDDAGPAGEQRLPVAGDVAGQRGGRPETGDDDLVRREGGCGHEQVLR